MRLIAIPLLFAAAVGTTAAEEARPAGEMKTRWAAGVDAAAPLPEHPRPSLAREGWINLNGRWDYAIVAKDAPQPEQWDGKIVVPFCAESQLSGVQRFVGPEKKLWYRRSFDRPGTKPGGRVLLHFGAIDWESTIRVNGKVVGKHQGGYDPIDLDITEALRDGANELLVEVWDPTDAGPQPRGKQVANPGGIFYTAVTGIWQTVWLEVVPEVHTVAVHFETVVSPRERNALRRAVPGEGVPKEPDSVTMTLRLSGEFDGQVKVEFSTPDGRGSDEAGGEVSGSDARLPLFLGAAAGWSPDHPSLYQAKVSLVKGGTVVDSFNTYFAYRTLSFGKDKHGINRLFLNGDPLFQYGPLDQGWWPDGLYTAPTDEALRYDIEMTRAMGFNMARKHVKVEPERWYYWADKLGLLVWQDMPGGFAGGRKKGEPTTDHGNFRRELEAMIDARRFHPSIVAWIPYNEGWGQPDAAGTNSTLQWTKQKDPSRFTGAASGWTDHGWGDWIDMHNYPGPGMHPVLDDRVSVLGEFGGLGLPVKGHLWWDKRNWGYRTYETKDELHANYATLMAKLDRLVPRGLAAAVYTQTTDCEGEVNGLMTYDRVPKFDPAWLMEKHAPLYRSPGLIRTTPVAPTAEAAKVEWGYTFETPAAGWEQPGFDDSAWQRGTGGFGTKDTPGARIGTEWPGKEIWLRRTFPAATPLKGRLILRIHHDEDATVFLNGLKIAELAGYTQDYFDLPLEAAAAAALKDTGNVLAVRCIQTRGGQFIDAGLADEVRLDD